MATISAQGLNERATYLVMAYLLRREEMHDIAESRYPTACDELLITLDAAGLSTPANLLTDGNVVPLFAAFARELDAFDELRALVLRIRRLWRTDEQSHYVAAPNSGSAD